MGEALAPLRDEGILILGSGMSFHNMRAYGDPRSTPGSEAFDAWLSDSMVLDGSKRAARLAHWAEAPAARFAHPPAQEEHLLPLMVASGAGSDAAGRKIWRGMMGPTAVGAWAFD